MMNANHDVDELYKRQIRPLSQADRLYLLAAMAHDLAFNSEPSRQGKRSILELEGLGAELWQRIDAQTYINELRDEWDRQP